MIAKIKKTPLSEEVYVRIKENLFSGEYEEGGLIKSENEFSELLCVSRVIVRKALQRLREEKIIVTYQGKGSFLANPKNFAEDEVFGGGIDFEKFKHIMDFRFAIENFAIKKAVKNASSDDLISIRKASENMKECMNDLQAFNEADYAFHLEIVKHAKNPLLTNAIENAKKEIIICLNAMNALPNSRKFALDLHIKIANAFLDRDCNEVIRLLKNNGEYNQARMINLLFKGVKK